MRTVQDHIEAADAADARAKSLRAEIAAMEAQIAHFDRHYLTGGYVLVSGAFEVIVRGNIGQNEVADPLVAWKSARNYVTQKEVEKVAARWNADHQGDAQVRWTGKDSLMKSVVARLKVKLVEEEKIVRASDPYFDASPSAQDFDANSSF